MLKKYAAFCDVGSNLLLQRMRRYINCNHNKNADTAVASFGAHSLLCFFLSFLKPVGTESKSAIIAVVVIVPFTFSICLYTSHGYSHKEELS